MKTTDAILEINPNGAYTSKEGRTMNAYRLTFNLSDEDMETITERILPTMENCDIADAMLAMLTYGIHCAYKDVTGQEFILPIDRKKPLA